jgi:hypothetical protein
MDHQPIRLIVETKFGERFAVAVPPDLRLGELAADFLRTPLRAGRHPTVEVRGKRRNLDATVAAVRLQDGQVVRIFDESEKVKVLIESPSGEVFVSRIPLDTRIGKVADRVARMDLSVADSPENRQPPLVFLASSDERRMLDLALSLRAAGIREGDRLLVTVQLPKQSEPTTDVTLEPVSAVAPEPTKDLNRSESDSVIDLGADPTKDDSDSDSWIDWAALSSMDRSSGQNRFRPGLEH